MKIIWLLLCLTPNFYCLPKEIDHNLQRRDVSEILSKDPEINRRNYPSRENETLLRVDSGRTIHHFTGAQQSGSQESLNIHASRAYLPPSQDTSLKSFHPNPVHSNNLNHQVLSNDFSSVKKSDSQTFVPQNPFSGSLHSLHYPNQQSSSISSSGSSNLPHKELDNFFPFTYNQLNSLSQLGELNKHSLIRQNNLETSEHKIKLNSFGNDNFNTHNTQFSYPRTASYHRNSNGAHLYQPQEGVVSPFPAQGININSQSLESSSPDSVPVNYDFKYEVAVNERGPDFGHEEKRTGDLITGQYNVLLPDGRRQIVKYEADDAGFRPQIFYDARSVLSESFPSRDPFSVQNVNTIVTDLLNSDLKRTRDQKSPSPPQYPIHQFNYLNDGTHALPSYGGNANFGRGLSATTGNIQDASHFYSSQQSSHLEPQKLTSSVSPYHVSYPGLVQNPQTNSNPQYGTVGQSKSTKFVNPHNSPTNILSSNIPQSGNDFEGGLLQLGQSQQKEQGFLFPHSYGLVYSKSNANNRAHPSTNPSSQLERNLY